MPSRQGKNGFWLLHLCQGGVAVERAVVLHADGTEAVGKGQILGQALAGKLWQLGGGHAVPLQLPQKRADKAVPRAGGVYRRHFGAAGAGTGGAGVGAGTLAAAGVQHQLHISGKERGQRGFNIDLEGNFDGYLFKISQNMVYHYVRRELLLQNYVDRLANESSDESVEIDEELDYLFLEEYILKLLEELPPARREVFMLYWKSGLNYREIADQLNISEKTVATQVHRSLDFLRDKLGIITFSVSLFLHDI